MTHRCIYPRCSPSCSMCNEAVPDEIDSMLADPHIAAESKRALTTPNQFLFLERQDRKHVERRQFAAEPVRHSAFGPFWGEMCAGVDDTAGLVA